MKATLVLLVIAGTIVMTIPDTHAQVIDIQAEDIRGRNVDTSVLRGGIILIGFATQKTSHALIEWQTEVGYDAQVTLKGGKDIFIIVVADASSFPRIIKPIVKMKLKGTYKRANTRLVERFEEHQTKPPDDVNDIIHFIPDWTGDIVKAFGIAEDMDIPHIFLIGKDGAIVGHFVLPSKATNQRILATVQQLLEKNP